jgi:hypothetical protein
MLKRKYLKDKPTVQIERKPNDSHAWTGIMKVKQAFSKLGYFSTLWGVSTHGVEPREKDIGFNSFKGPSVGRPIRRLAHLGKHSGHGYTDAGHPLNPRRWVSASTTRTP